MLCINIELHLSLVLGILAGGSNIETEHERSFKIVQSFAGGFVIEDLVIPCSLVSVWCSGDPFRLVGLIFPNLCQLILTFLLNPCPGLSGSGFLRVATF